MKHRSISARYAYTVCVAAIFASLSGTASAQMATKQLASHDASIDGSNLHYTTGGSRTCGPCSYMGLRKLLGCGTRFCQYLGRNSL